MNSEDSSGSITLPEITIEGDPDSASVNASDWWANGFVVGYNDPNTPAQQPLMINEELAASFFTGVENGQAANREQQAQFEENFKDKPMIGADLQGEAFEEVQRRYNELFEELFHEHMPHTEVDGEPGPGADVMRPNIVIVPE